MVENNWSFSDTKEWEKVSRWNCKGVEQSPINILTDTVTQCKSLCDAEFKYAPTKCKVNYKKKVNYNMIFIVWTMTLTLCGEGTALPLP